MTVILGVGSEFKLWGELLLARNTCLGVVGGGGDCSVGEGFAVQSKDLSSYPQYMHLQPRALEAKIGSSWHLQPAGLQVRLNSRLGESLSQQTNNPPKTNGELKEDS